MNRRWLYAAAAYNVCWGCAFVAAPGRCTRLLGVEGPHVPWQVVGMLVLVWAPGYWWAARNPSRHAHLVAIALLGKVLGPLGFAWAAARGTLPLRFGLTVVANDLVWWPAFAVFVRAAAAQEGGWRRFFVGG
jgi:hypothetical protein